MREMRDQREGEGEGGVGKESGEGKEEKRKERGEQRNVDERPNTVKAEGAASVADHLHTTHNHSVTHSHRGLRELRGRGQRGSDEIALWR